ncbi:MAG: YceI family protein [Marinobacterium sp.]|nr:YceI family protein [Marinobacterium sp.]
MRKVFTLPLVLSGRTLVFLVRPLAVFSLLFSLSAMVQAQWQLQSDESSLRYGTVKKGAVYEINSFDGLKGRITDQGMAELSVDLASVNTGISIRDTRMKTMLFNLAEFPQAKIQVPVELEQLQALNVGEMWPLSSGGILKLNGHEQTVLTELHVYRISETRWLVLTAQPVMIDAGVFGLAEGVEALRKIANLDSIMPQVPVYLELVFEQR